MEMAHAAMRMRLAAFEEDDAVAELHAELRDARAEAAAYREENEDIQRQHAARGTRGAARAARAVGARRAP